MNFEEIESIVQEVDKLGVMADEVFDKAMEDGYDLHEALALTRDIISSCDDEVLLRDALDWGLDTNATGVWFKLRELFRLHPKMTIQGLAGNGVDFTHTGLQLLLSDVELYEQIVFEPLLEEVRSMDDVWDTMLSMAYEIHADLEPKYYCMYCNAEANDNHVCDDCQRSAEEFARGMGGTRRPYFHIQWENPDLPKWNIPVEWASSGIIQVEAETLEDALNMVIHDRDINGEPFALPSETYYIEDTFKVDELDLEELKDYQ